MHLHGVPAAAGAAQSQYYLGVVQGESRKIPIVVLDIANETGNGKLTSLAIEVLQADLRRSQIFEVLDPKKLDVSYSAPSGAARSSPQTGGHVRRLRRGLGIAPEKRERAPA